MIFVTVGAQMPFDRLIKAVDEWACKNPDVEMLVQIGASSYIPVHLANWTKFIEPDDFRAAMERADVIVGHAGTGTIIMALEIGKPVLVMPRHANLGETRNDHQIATARRFGELAGVTVANDEAELHEKLDRLSTIEPSTIISTTASNELISAIRDFIHRYEQGSDSEPSSHRIEPTLPPQPNENEATPSAFAMEQSRRVG